MCQHLQVGATVERTDVPVNCASCVNLLPAPELAYLADTEARFAEPGAVRTSPRGRRVIERTPAVETDPGRPAPTRPAFDAPVIDESQDGYVIHAGMFDGPDQLDDETACGRWQPMLSVVRDRYVMARPDDYPGAHYCPACWAVPAGHAKDHHTEALIASMLAGDPDLTRDQAVGRIAGYERAAAAERRAAIREGAREAREPQEQAD